MKPEIQAWRDRLACSVRKIDDIFEEALHQARDVLSSAGSMPGWRTQTASVVSVGARSWF